MSKVAPKSSKKKLAPKIGGAIPLVNKMRKTDNRPIDPKIYDKLVDEAVTLKSDLIKTLNTLDTERASLFHPEPPTGVEYAHPGVFTDARGTILRLTDRSVGSVQVITSKKGTMRASHWHKTDSHLCHVVSGCIEYLERERGAATPAPSTRAYVFRAGESFFTGPRIDHEMHFFEDTTFIVMANRHRNPKEYEEDLVRLDTRLRTAEHDAVFAELRGKQPQIGIKVVAQEPAVEDGGPGAQP